MTASGQRPARRLTTLLERGIRYNRVTNLLDAPRCPHHTVAWLVRKRMLPTVSLICYLKIGVVCCVLEIA